MKIYTRTGDKGMTSFIGGVRVKKCDCCIDTYGDLDELNATIGVAMTFLEDEHLKEMCGHVQNDLFTVCGELAALMIEDPTMRPVKVHEQHVQDIENYIDEITEGLPPQTSFIIPGGTQASAFLHLCRTVSRRCEREIVALDEDYDINPHVLEYINRLSDLFYVMARKANKEIKEQQPIYRFFDEKD